MVAPLRVLDVGTQVAGPFAASLLADLGADVIKCERPDGGDPIRQQDGLNPRFQVEGRNKRSVTLDLRVPDGQDLLRRLAAVSDVLIENFRPGTMARWGLGYDDLAAACPRLVYVSVSGFGQDGPYSDRPAYNDIGAAFGGLTYVTGTPDAPPVPPGLFVADYMTGMLATVGALEAVRRRDGPGGTGRGSWIDCAMFESILRLTGRDMVEHSLTGVLRGRAERPPLRTRDGRWLTLQPVTNEQFARLTALVGDERLTDPELHTAPGRQRRRGEIDEILREWVQRRDLDELMSDLVAAEVPASPVNSVADLVADGHVVSRGSVVHAANVRGEVVDMPEAVPRFVGEPAPTHRPAQELGQSNEEVYLGLLGLDRSRYDDLVGRRVI